MEQQQLGGTAENGWNRVGGRAALCIMREIWRSSAPAALHCTVQYKHYSIMQRSAVQCSAVQVQYSTLCMRMVSAVVAAL